MALFDSHYGHLFHKIRVKSFLVKFNSLHNIKHCSLLIVNRQVMPFGEFLAN